MGDKGSKASKNSPAGAKSPKNDGGQEHGTPKKGSKEKGEKGEKAEKAEAPAQEKRASVESTIPSDREANIEERKQGFTYLIVTITHKPGTKFGLGVKNVYRSLYVCKIDDNTLVSGLFNIADRILDVDGHVVTDLIKCKSLLVKALKEKKMVTVLVERGVEEHAKKLALDEMNEEHNQSVMVPMDVRSIMKRMGERLCASDKPQPESALTKNAKERKACQVDSGHKSVMIMMDNENNLEKLKKVNPKEPR